MPNILFAGIDDLCTELAIAMLKERVKQLWVQLNKGRKGALPVAVK